MKLTNAERFLGIMIAEVGRNVGVDSEYNFELLKTLLENGDDWALQFEVPSLPESELPEHVREVMDILEMWTDLEMVYTNAMPEEKEKIDRATGMFPRARFKGISATREYEHYHAALVLIDRLGRWENFADRKLDSHSSDLPNQLKMKTEYKRMLKADPSSTQTVDGAIRILQTQRL